jgi:hypothetical protein
VSEIRKFKLTFDSYNAATSERDGVVTRIEADSMEAAQGVATAICGTLNALIARNFMPENDRFEIVSVVRTNLIYTS